MTPTEITAALRKVQNAIDMLVSATMFKDHPAESQAAIEARDFLLPQVIAAVEEGQVEVDIEEVGNAIEVTLLSHRLQYTCEENDEGNRLQLVDHLTPSGDGSIKRGNYEVQLIVDEVLDAISPFLRTPHPEPQPSVQSVNTSAACVQQPTDFGHKPQPAAEVDWFDLLIQSGLGTTKFLRKNPAITSMQQRKPSVITRVELLDPNGRQLVHHGEAELSSQDVGRTLKVFLKEPLNVETPA